LWACLALGLLATATATSNPGPIEEEIRHYVEQLAQYGTVRIGNEEITTSTLLPAFYERAGFQPAWSNAAKVEQLIAAIRASERDGLLPRDYHLGEILELQDALAKGGDPKPGGIAGFDILLTDALVRLAYHLNFGKVDPERLDPDWNIVRDFDDGEPVALVQELLRAPNLDAALDALRPRHPFYAALRKALGANREIAAKGEWPLVPTGPTLKPGARDPRVSALRARLAATGELHSDGVDDPSFYDPELEVAVKAFQEGHLLDPDGAVGPKTLRELNITAAKRVDQIRVNLERARWVLNAVPDSFVVVDIAGFRVFWVENGNVVWSTKAQVGRPYRETPAFRSKITYLVLNPTWTVPPTILDNDVLPAIRKNPGYLEKERLTVLDRHGQPVDPETVEWSQYGGKNFPYLLRQIPGAGNALGRIKIMFPNKHSVYLHDTPKKRLFKRASRTFSSGCIRIEEPFDLAVRLLNDPEKWSREKLMAAIDTGQTRTVLLPESVPVLLFYWTVAVDDADRVQFRSDIYQRDAAVLKALNGEFKPRSGHTWM